MTLDYQKKYDDFITTYEKLFHIQENESIDEVFNLIKTVLVEKYKSPILKIIKNIINSMFYNYRELGQYVELANRIFKEYSLITSTIDGNYAFIPSFC